MPYQSSDDEDYETGDEEFSDEEEIAAALAIEKERAVANGEEGQRIIYNTEVLHDKLEDIAWTDEQPWEETLAVTGTAPTQVENVDDDLERELAFYNQALDAAKTAIQKFEKSGTPWRRPTDYYAEMVKTDDHMARVKEQLLFEQKKIEESAQRRKEREAKRFSKQVSAERKKEKAQDKKHAVSSVASLRKQRQKSGFDGDLDMDAELAKMERGSGRNQPKGKLGERFAARDKSKKRAARDSKYGFGGPKGLKKQNDAYSYANVDGYKPATFDDGIARKVNAKYGTKGGVGKKKGAAAQRPGKARRQSMKGGRK